MTESLQPTHGSLSARLIRACPQHTACDLECPAREVEELGEVSSFDHHSLPQRIKEYYDQWRHSSPPSAKPS